MPIPSIYLAEFHESGIYHIYNRTNNKELLFINNENRRYFLKLYSKHISPVADTFCWSLLPNHFHFLVQIKSDAEINTYLSSRNSENEHRLSKTERKYLDKEISLDELVIFYFKCFFQSYAMAFNKVHRRSGNLFYRPFKRKAIVQDGQLTQAIVYIHLNAFKHKICKNFRDYKWSSWGSVFSEKPGLISRNKLLDWFGGLEQFILLHDSWEGYYNDADFVMVDNP